MDLNNLVERSPFAPPGAATTEQTNEAPAQLEFRGIAADESGPMFSIYDLTASRGYWVREGESGAVTVKGFDSSEGQIEVEQGGRMLTLKLKRASISVGAAQVVAVPAPGNTPNPRVGVAGGGAPPVDAKRLESVAAEVRRRRALRNAAQTPTPVVAPAKP